MDSSTESDHNLTSVSASDAEFITDLEGGKVTLTFCPNDLENYKACQSVLQWVYQDIPICSMEKASQNKGTIADDRETNGFLQIPSLAIVIFLNEEDNQNNHNGHNSHDKFEQAHEDLQKPPWTFHHSESVTRAMTSSAPTNNLDYYRAGDSGPLCGIRQMPSGKQIVRIVRFINYPEWQDNVDLYTLILSQPPEVTKNDFCLYTTGQMEKYNVQFAIKRAPKGITCAPVKNVNLNFRINHPGHIVPLLPFVCDNTSDGQWQSKDFDGNVINFEAQDRPETPDLSDLVLLEPIDSDSALSDSTVNAFGHSSDDEMRLPKTTTRLAIAMTDPRTIPVFKPSSIPMTNPSMYPITHERRHVDGSESQEVFYNEVYCPMNHANHDEHLLPPLSSDRSDKAYGDEKCAYNEQLQSLQSLQLPYEFDKLENPWSPTDSQCDSGQFSNSNPCGQSTNSLNSTNYSDLTNLNSTNLSFSPDDRSFNIIPRQQTRRTSQCSSDLGFQDRSSSTSESRWDDQDSHSRHQRQYNCDNISKLDVSVYGHPPKKINSHSDYGYSDGYASTCTVDESEISRPNSYHPQNVQNYDMHYKPGDSCHQNGDSNHHQYIGYPREYSKRREDLTSRRIIDWRKAQTRLAYDRRPEYDHIHQKPSKAHVTNGHQNGFRELLHMKQMSTSEINLDKAHKHAFRKLKRYKENQSDKDHLDLFNVSSHQDRHMSRHPDCQTSRLPDGQTSRHPDCQTSRHPDNATSRHPSVEASRQTKLNRKHNQKTKYSTDLRDMNNFKSVSDFESPSGSETEYEHVYESIERDLKIINNALYGKASQITDQKTMKAKQAKQKSRSKDNLKVLDSLPEQVTEDKELPYIQGFYV